MTINAQLLIVDDNISNLHLAVKTLINEKINIFTATSGKDAIEIIKHNHTDLLLLDIKMPDMDGFETLERLRRLPQHDNLPVIFLTSFNEKEMMQRCFKEGAVDFISITFLLRRVFSKSQDT